MDYCLPAVNDLFVPLTMRIWLFLLFYLICLFAWRPWIKLENNMLINNFRKRFLHLQLLLKIKVLCLGTKEKESLRRIGHAVLSSIALCINSVFFSNSHSFFMESLWIYGRPLLVRLFFSWIILYNFMNRFFQL